jgi:hypothetical protein
MENVTVGQRCRLPDDQPVKIISLHDKNTVAVVVGVSGWRKGTRAVCAVSKLGSSPNVARPVPDAPKSFA